MEKNSLIQKVNIENVENENYKSVKSPIIGTAYLAPEPGAKPFVEIGKKIKKRRYCYDS